MKTSKKMNDDGLYAQHSAALPSASKPSPARKIIKAHQKKLGEYAKRILTLEGDSAGLMKSVTNLQAAILGLAPRIAKLEEELRRQRGRLDSGAHFVRRAVSTVPPPPGGPQEYARRGGSEEPPAKHRTEPMRPKATKVFKKAGSE